MATQPFGATPKRRFIGLADRFAANPDVVQRAKEDAAKLESQFAATRQTETPPSVNAMSNVQPPEAPTGAGKPFGTNEIRTPWNQPKPPAKNATQIEADQATRAANQAAIIAQARALNVKAQRGGLGGAIGRAAGWDRLASRFNAGASLDADTSGRLVQAAKDQVKAEDSVMRGVGSMNDGIAYTAPPKPQAPELPPEVTSDQILEDMQTAFPMMQGDGGYSYRRPIGFGLDDYTHEELADATQYLSPADRQRLSEFLRTGRSGDAARLLKRGLASRPAAPTAPPAGPTVNTSSSGGTVSQPTTGATYTNVGTSSSGGVARSPARRTNNWWER